MQSCFLVSSPPDYIAKIAANFVWGVAFENQMLIFEGGGRFDLFRDGEKRAERHQSKMGVHKVGVNNKM